MEKIYVFGAGGFAIEVAYLIGENQKYKVAAFVDRQEANGIDVDGCIIPVISESDFLDLCNKSRKNAAIAIANNEIVQKIVERFVDKCDFPNIIHPSFKTFGEVKLGRGNIIAYGNLFSVGAEIGSFNRFNMGCGVGHGTQIGDFNMVNPGCRISGDVTIGNCNMLGVNSSIMQGISIANYDVLGGGSFLAKDIKEEHVTYLGVPARKCIF